jgi:hypothetical protein
LKEVVRPRRFTAQDVVRLASHVTERDRQIAVDCFDHRVLTTDQIKRLHFTDTRTTVARLDVLYRLRVLDRFRPSRPRGRGTAPYHWILDEGGALIIAAEKGVERAKLGWQHALAVGVATSPKLTHHVEVNEFVVRLVVEAQAAGGMLTHWHGERWLHPVFDGMLLPDTYAALALWDGPALHVLVELDRATETLQTLREKAERYERRLDYKFWREVDPLVLFVVPSDGRARTVTDTLAGISPSLAVIVWNNDDATRSVFTAVMEASEHRRLVREWEQRREREDAEIRRAAQPAPAGVGRAGGYAAGRLRSVLASDLLDHPQHPNEQEPTP